MNLCESLVNTKLRYVLKSEATTGIQKIYLVSENTKVSISLDVSVEVVVTEVNALNGESIKNALESGEGYFRQREGRLEESAALSYQ